MNQKAIHEIEERDAQRCLATIACDAAAMAGFLSDDLRYTHSSAAVEDKKAYMERATVLGYRRYMGFKNIERAISVYGEIAIVHGDVAVDLILDNARKTLDPGISRYGVMNRAAGVC